MSSFFETLFNADLFPTMFDYLTQQELLDNAFISRQFHANMMKYIDNMSKVYLHWKLDGCNRKLVKKLYQNGCIIYVKLNRDLNCKHLKYVFESEKDNLIEYVMRRGNIDINEVLYCACRYANRKYLFQAIENGADNWNLGLFGACEGGHPGIVDNMIKRGADCFQDGLYKSIESDADPNKNGLIRQMLKDYGASPNDPECIMRICKYDYVIEVIKEFVNEMDKSNVQFYLDTLNRCLTRACTKNNIEIVKFMIEKGANDFDAALACISIYGNVELMVEFISLGASNIDCAADGIFYSSYLTINCKIELARFLISKGYKNYFEICVFACKYGLYNLFKEFIADIPLHALKGGYYELLYFAIYGNSKLILTELTELLLKLLIFNDICEINIQIAKCISEQCCESDMDEMFDNRMKIHFNECKQQIKCKMSMTIILMKGLLHRSKINIADDYFKIIFDKCPEILNQKNMNKLLKQCMTSNDISVVKYIIEKGATDFDGAFDEACFNQNTKMMKYLMENYEIKNIESGWKRFFEHCHFDTINFKETFDLYFKTVQDANKILETCCEIYDNTPYASRIGIYFKYYMRLAINRGATVCSYCQYTMEWHQSNNY